MKEESPADAGLLLGNGGSGRGLTTQNFSATLDKRLEEELLIRRE